MAQSDHTTSETEASWVKQPGAPQDQLLEENWLFRLRKQRFQSRHSGKAHDFYVIDLADAVHVVALTPDGQVTGVVDDEEEDPKPGQPRPAERKKAG